MTKTEQRILAKEIKKTIDFPLVSKGICENLANVKEFRQASRVMLYNALEDEPSLDSVIDFFDKEYLFPAIENGIIVARRNSVDSKIGLFGIKEPLGEAAEKHEINLIVIPGVMFDKNFNRLGRGKGYYDRFLSDFTGVKLGVCPDSLLADFISAAPHDVKPDIIVTEKRVLYRKNS